MAASSASCQFTGAKNKAAFGHQTSETEVIPTCGQSLCGDSCPAHHLVALEPFLPSCASMRARTQGIEWDEYVSERINAP